MIKFSFKIPKFTIEKRSLLVKYVDLNAHRDIDYVIYHGFSNKLNVKVEDAEEMKGLTRVMQ